MFSLKLVVCVCVIFTNGIEAAPEPKPEPQTWCLYPPCFFGEGGFGGSGIQTYRPIFYNRAGQQEGEYCGPCYCPPSYTAGECGEGLTWVNVPSTEIISGHKGYVINEKVF